MPQWRMGRNSAYLQSSERETRSDKRVVSTVHSAEEENCPDSGELVEFCQAADGQPSTHPLPADGTDSIRRGLRVAQQTRRYWVALLICGEADNASHWMMTELHG